MASYILNWVHHTTTSELQSSGGSHHNGYSHTYILNWVHYYKCTTSALQSCGRKQSQWTSGENLQYLCIMKLCSQHSCNSRQWQTLLLCMVCLSMTSYIHSASHYNYTSDFWEEAITMTSYIHSASHYNCTSVFWAEAITMDQWWELSTYALWSLA